MEITKEKKKTDSLIAVSLSLMMVKLFMNLRQVASREVVNNEEYTDNAEKYAYYDNNQGEQIQIVYKDKQSIGYCYIAKKTDDTELIYYKGLDGILDYIEKTIKK